MPTVFLASLSEALLCLSFVPRSVQKWLISYNIAEMRDCEEVWCRLGDSNT